MLLLMRFHRTQTKGISHGTLAQKKVIATGRKYLRRKHTNLLCVCVIIIIIYQGLDASYQSCRVHNVAKRLFCDNLAPALAQGQPITA